MTEAELDALFAAAREETVADAGAAERFLAQHRAEVVPTTRMRGWWPWPLAAAAVVAGVLALQPLASPLPASAAYDAYHGALGEGW